VVSLLSVGAVVPRKDHGLLIEALGGLADRPWHLRIVGNTTRAAAHVERLRSRIAALGLEERIELAGELDGGAFEAAWRGADLYVASSRHEGYGMAVAEALARGLPVVTTAAGAVGEWIDRRAALVVPIGEVATLRAALASLLDDANRRRHLRDGARTAGAGLPSWDDTARIVDAALRRIVDAG
jgi:glycosyltransferase involved in cell wall biosynthesis